MDPIAFVLGYLAKKLVDSADLEIENVMRTYILRPFFKKIDEEHKKYEKNLDVLEELIGHPANFQYNVGSSHGDFRGMTPDDKSAAQSMRSIFGMDYSDPKDNLGPVNVDLPNLCLGGPTSNNRTRDLLGYGGSSFHLKIVKDMGIRFLSLNDLDDKPKDYGLKKYAAKKQVPMNPWIWHDKYGKYDDFVVKGHDGEFQKYDYLKITKLRENVFVDGLHGLGTTAIRLLLRERNVISDAISEIQRKADARPKVTSYEAIFEVKIRNDETKQVSNPVDIKFVNAEPFTPTKSHGF